MCANAGSELRALVWDCARRRASVWQCARCASASLESSIHRGASAPPGACAAYPSTDRCAFIEGGGVGLGSRRNSDNVVPIEGIRRSELCQNLN